MLRRMDEFKSHTIVRTRDQALLETFDVLVDVGSSFFFSFPFWFSWPPPPPLIRNSGSVYDHSKKRYDHHQSTFQGTFDDKHSIRLSSAGLIYKSVGLPFSTP